MTLDDTGHASVAIDGASSIQLEVVREDGTAYPVIASMPPAGGTRILRDLASLPGRALPIVSTREFDRERVWLADASHTYAALDLPTRAALPPLSCTVGPRSLNDPDPCRSMTACTVHASGYLVTDDGIAGFAGAALAPAPDGGAWVAAIWNQVDQDRTLTPFVGAFGRNQCMVTVTADRGRTLLVLFRLSADGARLDERWTGALDPDYIRAELVRLAARGDRLLVAVAQLASDVRYLELDTAQLE